jgi:hypothetical protein
MPLAQKASILEELRAWANDRYGGLEQQVRQDEWYEVSGALSGRPG